MFICYFSFYFCLLPSRWIKLFNNMYLIDKIAVHPRIYTSIHVSEHFLRQMCRRNDIKTNNDDYNKRFYAEWSLLLVVTCVCCLNSGGECSRGQCLRFFTARLYISPSSIAALLHRKPHHTLLSSVDYCCRHFYTTAGQFRPPRNRYV